MKGYVYLLLKVSKSGEESYKVGVSKNDPLKRVKQLQTGNEAVIHLLKYFETEYYNKLEKMLHFRYISYKTEANNEWFELPAEEVLNFIDSCKDLNETLKYLKEHNPFF